MSHKTLNKILLVCIFIAFFVFLLLSNYFDWDHFISFFEVELRSWLVDHELPLWTYQLCGGVTRLGDPQSFGLSPIFIIVAIFGSFWGSKMMVLSCFVIGFSYVRKLVDLVFDNREQKYFTSVVFSLLFVFSNFFLWQIHHGHLTIALMMLALGLIYYSIKTTIYEQVLTKKEFICFIFLGWMHFSAGLYHSTIFLVLPFSISLLMFLIIIFFKKRLAIVKLPSFRQFIIALFSIALCSSYKLLGVLNYQRDFPRTITTLTEQISILNWLKINFIPTFDYQLIWGEINGQLWGIWEYSSFSMIFWIFLVVVIEVFVKKNTHLPQIKNKPIIQFAIIYFFVSFLFSLGNFSKWSPLTLLNTFILNNSVRVSGRFSIGVLLASLIILSEIYPLTELTRKTINKYCPIFVFLLVINFMSFRSTLSWNYFLQISKTKSIIPEKMEYQHIVPLRNNQASFMYPAVMAGVGVINCYEPLSFKRELVSEYPGKQLERTNIPFINGEEACLKDSFFTQNKLNISSKCITEKTCLNINLVRERNFIFKICSQEKLMKSIISNSKNNP